MSEVKGNTSQGSVLSGVNQKSSVANFDMRSWQGLTGLLQAAREAHMEDTAYAAFRDMVLSYAQSGGDPALKARIDAVVKTLGKTEEITAEAPAQTRATPEPIAKKLHVGSSVRPAPVLGIAQTSVPDSKVLNPHQDEIDVQPLHEQEVRLETPPDPMPEIIPQVPVEAEPEIQPVEMVVPTVEETPAPVAQRAPMKTVEEYKARITEIKRIVHNDIGNPVTLMDAGNHVGRTYMNALLTAMKASGGSSPVGIDSAMQKLEEAFTQIQAFGKKKRETESQAVVEPVLEVTKEEIPVSEVVPEEPLAIPEPEPTPVPEVEPEPVIEPKPVSEPEPILEPIHVEPIPEPTEDQVILKPTVIVEEEKSVPEEIQIPEVEVPVAEIIPPLPKAEEQTIPEVVHHEVNEPVDVPRHEPPVNLPIHESHQEEKIHNEPTPEPEPLIVETSIPERIPEQKEELEVPVRESVPEPGPVITQTPAPEIVLEEQEEEKQHELPVPIPVAEPQVESEPSETRETDILVQRMGSTHKQIFPNPVNTTHEIKDAVRDVEQADLDSEEVTTALNQLLHEWNIFSSSGIFGTGPAGKDHPLYQKLAHLPMLTVSNGGWDDAILEHRQSIKDYISAWRHEQSISYNPTETFEHYLRRVVQRVLRRQRGL